MTDRSRLIAKIPRNTTRNACLQLFRGTPRLVVPGMAEGWPKKAPADRPTGRHAPKAFVLLVNSPTKRRFLDFKYPPFHLKQVFGTWSPSNLLLYLHFGFLFASFFVEFHHSTCAPVIAKPALERILGRRRAYWGAPPPLRPGVSLSFCQCSGVRCFINLLLLRSSVFCRSIVTQVRLG